MTLGIYARTIFLSDELERGYNFIQGSLYNTLGLMSPVAHIPAVILILVSAYFLDPTVKRQAIAALPAGLLGGIFVWSAIQNHPPLQFQALKVRSKSGRVLPLIIGLVSLGIVTEINGNWFHIPTLQNVSHHVQFGMLFVGIVSISWGLGGRFPTPRRTRQSKQGPMKLWAIVGVMFIAMGLRLWRVEESIPLFVDEFNYVEVLRYFEVTNDMEILQRFESIMSFPRLFAYGEYVSVSFLGHTLDGLRFLSAVIGTLTVGAVFLLTETLFNRRVAIIAAILLATFPPHLQFSRLGLINIADPLFGTLTLAFLARGLRSGSQLSYVLGGVALGFTQYFHESGRLLYPVVVGLWIGMLWWQGYLRWQEIRLFVLAAVIVTIPVYYTVFGTGVRFLPRFSETSNVNSPLLPRLLEAALVYVHVPDRRLYVYYFGGVTALTLPLFVPIFLLGFFGALRWIFKSPGMLLLIIWLVFTSLGNSLLIAPAVYARYVVVMPAIVILLALGIAEFLPVLLRLKPRFIYAGLVVIIAVVQVAYYFGPHLKVYREQVYREYVFRDEDDALLRALAYEHIQQIHFIASFPPDWRNTTTKLRFFNDQLVVNTIVYQREALDDYLAALPRDVSHIFFIPPDDYKTLAILDRYFMLDKPRYSQRVPLDLQYALYYAPPQKSAENQRDVGE